ncbi:hypothetical protein DICVIV_11048 [Dictyocaulus viviparus]|uniref:Bestrophin homolog n=1 Tax=Dictyocaulus viviparus TaxID=29172 RepID=A0A0D8XKT0_DICVI|nr:hypothetical protein DICVIV_11048 [Dictyocaulus viviparus]
MTTSEKARIETEDIKRVYWMPIEWANQLLKKCYLKDQIDPYHYGILCETILKYREMLHNLLSFDWINVPLVYTQVVHVCTVAYFGIICFASQSINEPESEMWINEFVIPVFAIYEFIFFVGWLKVAQVMLNPFGMDDDDFEIDMVIERNLQIGYSFVDSMYDKLPPLIYVDVAALPHTKASMALITKANPMVGSVANVDVPRAEQQVISKADVEIIRKLVGPRFGRRFHYDHSKYNNDMDRITNSPEEHDLGKKSSKSNSFLKKHIIQPNNTPNPSREHDTSVAKKVGSSYGIHGGDVIGEVQKKLERHKNALHTENQHDSLEKTQSPPSRDCKTTSAQSKILNPTQFSSELIEHKNSSKPFKLGTIRHSSLQHTQKTAPNTLRESSTTALTGGWGKSEEKILEKLSTTKFNSKDKISRNGRQLHGSTENRRITEEKKEILTLENPTEHSTPKLRTKLTARKKESRKKMTPKPESLLSSATPTSIKTWKSSHHLKKSK